MAEFDDVPANPLEQIVKGPSPDALIEKIELFNRQFDPNVSKEAARIQLADLQAIYQTLENLSNSGALTDAEGQALLKRLEQHYFPSLENARDTLREICNTPVTPATSKEEQRWNNANLDDYVSPLTGQFQRAAKIDPNNAENKVYNKPQRYSEPMTPAEAAEAARETAATIRKMFQDDPGSPLEVPTLAQYPESPLPSDTQLEQAKKTIRDATGIDWQVDKHSNLFADLPEKQCGKVFRAIELNFRDPNSGFYRSDNTIILPPALVVQMGDPRNASKLHDMMLNISSATEAAAAAVPPQQQQLSPFFRP